MGLVTVGEALQGARAGHGYSASVLAEGRVQTADGREFDTPSGAAEALTGKANNGWEFWSVTRSGDKTELARIRERYLAEHGEPEGGGE